MLQPTFITSIYYWWLILFVLGIINFPLTYYFFTNFWDRGYALSKVLSILIISYVVWLVSSIFPVFSRATIFIVIIALLILNIVLFTKYKRDISGFLKTSFHIVIVEEFLCLITLLFWSYVRSHLPDINGLEKFMDFGFLNASLISKSFPPTDMWYSPLPINYYYYGHYISAMLTKLSNIDPAITYNLMIATVFSLSFTSCFSLSSNIVHLAAGKSEKDEKKRIFSRKLVLYGIISSCLLTMAGNLHTVRHIWEGVNKYWYPDATRYIPFTIHEFPLYSFVVADLHAHFMNIPFVIFGLSTLLVIFYRRFIKFELLSIQYYILYSFLLAIFFITNSLDAAIYICFFALVLFYSNYYLNRNIIKSLISALPVTAMVVLLGVLFSLPFHLHFEPFSSSIGIVTTRSEVDKLLVLWGFFWFSSVVFTLAVLSTGTGRIGAVNSFAKKMISIIANLFGLDVITRKSKSDDKSSGITLMDLFVFTMIITALFLNAFPEFFYFKDIYQNDHYRANTLFKLGYQSFILYSVITAYIIFRLNQLLSKNSYNLWLIVFVFGLISVMSYPYFAVKTYYNSFKNFRGLNGLSYLDKKYPDDYKAILWIIENIKEPEVIIEAVGESYTDYARVSANTGLPTVVGWRVHEWLWRGSFDPVGKRTEEVQAAFTTTDEKVLSDFIKKYDVKYVFIGNLERKQYKELNEQNFKDIGEEIFRSGKTVIYEIISN